MSTLPDTSDAPRPKSTLPRIGVARADTLIPIAAAARRLALSVSTLRRAIDRGELPAARFGRAVRISEDDLAAFVSTHRTTPRATVPRTSAVRAGPRPKVAPSVAASSTRRRAHEHPPQP